MKDHDERTEETQPRRGCTTPDRKNKKIRNRRNKKFRRRTGGAEDQPSSSSHHHHHLDYIVKKRFGLEREEANLI
jgi:hypothetical protein